MSDKTLVERLNEQAKDNGRISYLLEEAADLIEQLTQGNDGETPKSVDDVRSRHSAFEHWYKQGGGYRSQEIADVGFLLGIIEQLTASRDRHERDVDVFRQRWIEKCAEVEALRKQIADGLLVHPITTTHGCLICGGNHGDDGNLPCPNMAPRSAV